MFTYGLIVEGQYDQEVFPELIKKIVSENSQNEVKIIARPCDGKEKLFKNFPKFLEIFKHCNNGIPVDIAFVIQDADCRNHDELKKKLLNKIRNKQYPFKIQIYIVIQELETWLMADEKAISKVANGKKTKSIKKPLETICDAKEQLKKLLNVVGLQYIPTVLSNIVKEADISTIRDKCPHFQDFIKAINDC